jgi:hypothetical protein
MDLRDKSSSTFKKLGIRPEILKKNKKYDRYFREISEKVKDKLSPQETDLFIEDIISFSSIGENEKVSLRERLYKIFCIRR